jgi:NitT/TauT family transport system substrate-binding protein
VQRFVNSYMRAFADVVQNPSEAADIIVRANPEYAPKRGVLVQQLEADIKSTFFSNATKANGIGWMANERWQQTVKILVDQGAMKQTIDASAAFTDVFLAKASALKR